MKTWSMRVEANYDYEGGYGALTALSYQATPEANIRPVIGTSESGN